MDLLKCKKIALIGNSAAGKSTLSNFLGNALKLNVFTIDKIFWLPGWELRDENAFRKLHREWVNQESWLIDGVGYWEEMEYRMTRADIVLFLDVPIAICKERAEIRINNEQMAPNPDITTGCVYANVKKLQMEAIDNFHNTLRPKILHYLSSMKPDKVRIINGLDELNLENKGKNIAKKHEHSDL